MYETKGKTLIHKFFSNIQRVTLSSQCYTREFIFNVHFVGIALDFNAVVAGIQKIGWIKNGIEYSNLNHVCFQQITVKPGLTGCIVLVILFHYFSLTNFFWMLVEGKSTIKEKPWHCEQRGLFFLFSFFPLTKCKQIF